MVPDRELETRDGRAWRIGHQAEVAWIQEGTPGGLAITSAIPPVFAAYATLELPGTGDDDAAQWSIGDPEDRHDAAVLAVLSEHTAPQCWWLGYLETGAYRIPFDDAPTVSLYASWNYVLVEAGPRQAAVWRPEHYWKGALPDLIFPADRSWLVSTLWDDDWACIGGTQALVDAFLHHPDLRERARQVALSDKDTTPPGHEAR
jgi:hypothetical protein